MYNPQETEKKWQTKWEETKLYETDMSDKSKDPYYNLVMFPYPSGDKLHIGHWYNFAPADSWGRFQRMLGKNVFQPMGYDAFGLPAENYAIKTGVSPVETTAKNTAAMTKQLKAIGAMYDWSRTLNTSTPEYYKWTQWCFLKMYEEGLAYKRKAPVNWCNSCQTVLANEQAQDGKCDRCDSVVEKKDLEQWFLNIKSYAEELLDHSDLDWPEKTKLMQKNWIGKSTGCDVSWKVDGHVGRDGRDGHDLILDTFTTTVDTIYGTTFVVISPEHPELMNIVTESQKDEVEKYIEEAQKRSDIDRMAEGKEKTGVDTGVFVLNPFTGEKAPLWVADYVLMNYGTGVVMGVPAHDQRDMDFANKYSFEIVESIQNEKGETFVYDDVDKYSVKGEIIDSGEFTGLDIQEGRKKITEELEKKNLGKAKIQYKLRDWLISRQRYWGAPIPIIHCDDCGSVPVPKEDLPVLLPTEGVDYKPKGKSPLASVDSFVNVKCPKCDGDAKREVDTMDTFLCSSWYQLRYTDPSYEDGPFDPELVKKWLPVDMYIGGPEHACMHLLYARFFHKVMLDDKKAEPFKRLVHQGLVTKDGAKMSKSKGNVVSPDSFVEKYGSDVFRMYLMFMGPFTQGGDWNDKGITGVKRFVDKFYNLITSETADKISHDHEVLVHKTVKRVSDSIDRMQFNTALAALMEFVNAKPELNLDAKKTIVQLMAPQAPHLAEELWEVLGQEYSIFDAGWPTYDESKLVENVITIAVQVNGKVRGDMQVASDTPKDEIIKSAKEIDNVKNYLEGEIIKEIYVPGKLVSLVVK